MKIFFPNLHTFKLVFTLPFGPVSCECSFSAVHRLKFWSMSEDRLCGLALYQDGCF